MLKDFIREIDSLEATIGLGGQKALFQDICQLKLYFYSFYGYLSLNQLSQLQFDFSKNYPSYSSSQIFSSFCQATFLKRQCIQSANFKIDSFNQEEEERLTHQYCKSLCRKLVASSLVNGIEWLDLLFLNLAFTSLDTALRRLAQKVFPFSLIFLTFIRTHTLLMFLNALRNLELNLFLTAFQFLREANVPSRQKTSNLSPRASQSFVALDQLCLLLLAPLPLIESGIDVVKVSFTAQFRTLPIDFEFLFEKHDHESPLLNLTPLAQLKQRLIFLPRTKGTAASHRDPFEFLFLVIASNCTQILQHKGPSRTNCISPQHTQPSPYRPPCTPYLRKTPRPQICVKTKIVPFCGKGKPSAENSCCGSIMTPRKKGNFETVGRKI